MSPSQGHGVAETIHLTEQDFDKTLTAARGLVMVDFWGEWFGPRTVYERFFSFRPLLPEQAHAFANVDYRQRMAIVAEVDDGREPELVGVARYGPSDEGTADIGLVVADAWQGLGLGSLLLEEILHAGEQRSIHEFSAEVLTDNRRALSLQLHHGNGTVRGWRGRTGVDPGIAFKSVRRL